MTNDTCVMLCARNKTRQLSPIHKRLSIKSAVTSSFACSVLSRSGSRGLWGRQVSWADVRGPFRGPLDRSRAPLPAGRLLLPVALGAEQMGTKTGIWPVSQHFWGNGRVEFCVGPSRVIPGSDWRANVFGNFLTSCASEP